MGSLESGEKSIAVAGTAERLSSASVSARWVDIQAKYSNTDNMFIGGSTVDNNSGIALSPGASITIGGLQQGFVVDISGIWVDAVVNGEGVTYNYWLFP